MLHITSVWLCCRCGGFRERSFICWEVAAVYDAVWLHSRPAQWPQVEGDKTSGTKRTCRICHAESRRHYRRHIPWGCANGESATSRLSDSSIFLAFSSYDIAYLYLVQLQFLLALFFLILFFGISWCGLFLVPNFINYCILLVVKSVCSANLICIYVWFWLCLVC